MGKHLSMAMNSARMGPLHCSVSSITITMGLLQLCCSLYQDARTNISAACLTNTIERKQRSYSASGGNVIRLISKKQTYV